MLYEGKGDISLKKWLHTLWDKLFNKNERTAPEESSNGLELISVIQKALTDAVHLPLTDSQKDKLSEYLKPLLLDAAQVFVQAAATDKTNNN